MVDPDEISVTELYRLVSGPTSYHNHHITGTIISVYVLKFMALVWTDDMDEYVICILSFSLFMIQCLSGKDYKHHVCASAICFYKLIAFDFHPNVSKAQRRRSFQEFFFCLFFY